MALTAKDLKNAILQMAMEGKLVSQDPKEEPASALLDRIQEEKKKLIKEKKIKADKNESVIFRRNGFFYERIGTEEKCIDDEIPFEIPESWEWVRLGFVISLLSGCDLSPDHYSAEMIGMPYLTGASNIQNGRLIINRWTDAGKNISHRGDLLLTCKGTVGKTCILDVEEAHIARQYMALTAIGFDTAYLELFIQIMIPSLVSKSKGLIPGIERKDVLNLLLPLPPLAEQKRIVAKIESILPSLDAFEKAQTKLDELNASYKEGLKNSILQYAMEGKLVSQDPREEPASALLDRIQEEKKLIKEKKIKADKNESVIFRRNGFFYERIGKEEKCIDDEIPFEIPESWEWTRLKNIASTQLGKALNTSKDQGELVPYLCSINVYWNTIDVSQVKKARFSVDEKKKFSVQPGDIFVVEGGDAGRTAIWEGKDQVYYQNALHRVRFLPNAIVPLFFVFLMKTYKGLGLLGGKSKGMTIQHFVKHELDALLLPLPPLAEQKRIVATIKTIFAVLDGN